MCPLYTFHIEWLKFLRFDEITVMRDGVSVMYDETTNLTYNQIVKAMVGRELDEQFPDRTYEPQDIVLNVKAT